MSINVRQLLVQSKDRIRGTAESFTIPTPRIEGLCGVELLNATIPNTLYNVTTANNILWVNIPGGLQQIAITPGAYNIATVISAITAALTAALPLGTWTVTYNESTMRITITSTNYQWSAWVDTTTVNSLWPVLGFNATLPTTFDYSHTGLSIIALNFPSFLTISIREFANAQCVSTSQARSNFPVSFGQNSQYVEIFNRNTQYNNEGFYTLGNVLSYLTIELRDPDNNLISLNGGEWSFLLGLIYKSGESD